MPLFVADRILTGDGGLSASPAWALVEGGHIVAVGSGDAPAQADRHDLSGLLLAPAFCDLQINGVGPVDFATATRDEIVDAVDAVVDSGCSTLLPTICTAPLDAYDAMLERLAAARRARPEPLVGVHLEGPFLGGAPGAHPVDLVRSVDLDWLLSLCDRFPGLVWLVTLAPEADPGFAATRALSERGIVVALGHTTATYDTARAAAGAGARLATHCFNGMGPLHHREPGVVGAALDDRRLVPSFIADLVHVHPAVLRLLLAARPDAVCVSDRVASDATDATDAVRLADGTLAGSVVTMAQAVRNLVASGIPTGQAVRTATGNPARAMGLADRGRIAAGCRADLIGLDVATLSLQWRWPGPDRPGS